MLGRGEVTAGLAESNDSLPPGLWPRADCRGPASALKPFARFEYGTTCTFYIFYYDDERLFQLRSGTEVGGRLT